MKIKTITKWSGILLCALFLFILSRGIYQSIELDNVDFNPFVRSGDEFAANWQSKDSVLTLRGNSTYLCVGKECENYKNTGDWERVNDFQIRFSPSNGAPIILRIAIKDGLLTLVEGATARDPDEWNPYFTFTHPTWKPK